MGAMTTAAARERLRRMVAASTAPCLDESDLAQLLQIAKRPTPVPRRLLMFLGTGQFPAGLGVAGSIAWGLGLTRDRPVYVDADDVQPWQPSTAYAEGAYVTPDTRNGLRYVCTGAGTSGSSAPSWPLSVGGTVDDGSATWKQDGVALTPTWDLNKAAAEGWSWKAGAAAGKVGVSLAGNAKQLQQVYDHCMMMAAMFRERRVFSVSLTDPHPRANAALRSERESIDGWENALPQAESEAGEA